MTIIRLKFSMLVVLMMMIWVSVVSCAEIEAGRRRLPAVRQITIARIALEAQFVNEKKMDLNDHNNLPDRVSPGGPDPRHHFRRL
ncbi:hypothetical protein ABFX02_08G136300 [Erythranthe guttata]